jgi:hypothetical protein
MWKIIEAVLLVLLTAVLTPLYMLWGVWWAWMQLFHSLRGAENGDDLHE